jgi:hypothetical protein
MDHAHAFGQIQGLLNQSCELVGFSSQDPAAAVAQTVRRRWPDVMWIEDPTTVLRDPSIDVIVTAAVPDRRSAIAIMGEFLWYAADLPGFALGKVYNYAWSLGMTIGPIVALVLLWDDRGSTSFVLTAIGLGIVIVGILIVSNVWKTPTYKVILSWDPEALPAGWEAVRRRYFNINWVQMVTTWSAFILFLVAMGFR